MSEDNEHIRPSFDGDADSVLFKSIIETAVDAIVVITGDGRICLVNPATEKLFGYKATELVGQNVSILMPEPHHSQHDGYLRNYLNTGEQKIIGSGREVDGRRKDGSTFPMYLSVAKAEYSSQCYFTGIIHNLSKQKEIQAALRLNEQHLRDVTEAASDWTWEMDQQFRFTYMSDRFYSLTGVAPVEVVGRTRWELTHDDPESPFWKRHRNDLEQHRKFRDFVYRLSFGDTPARELHFKVSGKPVFDETGQFYGYRGIGTDVTEHILAKRALRESRRSLETLVSNVPGMVYRCRNDHDWAMEFVSEGGQHVTGYSPTELMNGDVTFGSLIHADDQEFVWREVQTALTARLPFEISYRIYTATGEEKWVWEHGCGVYSEDGSIRALEGLILDISERRQTEQALRALATSTALGGGEDFIANCARELANTYGAQYAFIGVFADDTKESIRTIAVWMDNAIAKNFVYELKGTPCQDILRTGMEIIPSEATRRYPQDRFLRDFGVESYFGIPLVDSTGETVGLVSVLGTHPMQPNVWTYPILGIFASRIALELERQQADDRLRESEDFMRLTLENAPIGIASADLSGRLLDTNPAFSGLLGYSHNELMGMHLNDITYPEDREETRRHFEALIRGDFTHYELVKRYLHKNGDVLHVRVQAGLVRDAEGRPVRVVGEVEDETERLRSAREIQRMRVYLKNIIDSMPSVLVGVDTEGRVMEWNRSAERTTGVTSDDAVGSAFTDLFPELAGQLANVSEAIRLHQPIQTERLPMKKDGETRYAEVMVYPLQANGHIGAVIRMDDITERIRIEQMMMQTEKMLSVGGLAAGMAHEISNPLSVVMQSAQNTLRRISKDLPANQAKADELGLDLDIMHRYLESRGVTEFIEGIQGAGKRASRIVADMLAFSRSSTSQLTLNHLDEMLETVVRLAANDYSLKKKYDFRQIEIVREYDANLGEVPCDRQQIEQVLLNLIKNAAHATAEAPSLLPPRITLRTQRDDSFAEIEVEDNGPGMDEATRKRAFEPFFTTKETGIGTGLGLSVSYFIITQQHKGSIDVSSRAGEGCRFTIRLPLTGAEAE